MMSNSARTWHGTTFHSGNVHFISKGSVQRLAKADISPKTRLSGSLMLTVWSWEAERELLIDRSPERYQWKKMTHSA